MKFPAASSLATAFTWALVQAVDLHVQAQTFIEGSDAGQALATASPTGIQGTPLSTILGNLPPLGGVSSDVDFYLINIANPAGFSASTFNLGTTVALDTVLFLMTLAGQPILLNDDDAGGLTFASTIPANSLSIAPQIVILGVAPSGIDPVTAASQFLFDSGTASTDLRGPNPSLAGAFNGFLDAGFRNFGGAYQVDLTGAEAVPESTTWLSGALGISLATWVCHRRRAAANRPLSS